MMKRLTKNKTLSFVLAFIMVFTALPISSLRAAATVIGGLTSNFGSVIGNTASFNIDQKIIFSICDKPSEFNDEPVRGDWANDEYLIHYDPEKNQVDFSEDLVLVITNYYFNSETSGLWFKVDAAPGYTLPGKLKKNPWVFQNHINNYEDPQWSANSPDSLIISDSGKNFIFDENGSPVSSVELSRNTYSQKIIAVSTLQGAVEYQWQIFAADQWIDIYGADEAELDVTLSPIATVLDENQTAKVRVVSKSANKTVLGDAITVTAVSDAAENSGVSAFRALRAAANGGLMPANEAGGKVTVTVKFVYGANNEPVDAEKVFEIQEEGAISQTIVLKTVAGYDAYLEDDTTTVYTTFELNLTNVTEDITITFKYWPAKVNYTVVYYWQNVENDNYTEHERYTATDFTGNKAEVDDRVYDGFYQLLYESVPIASDGSTVIEVYYDRLYYKMLFDLDGGYGVQPIYARYGTGIDVPSPIRAGYSFVGWDDITSGNGDGIADTLPDTVPANDSKYKAIWQAADNAKVTVVYWGENANNEDYSYIKSQEIFVTPGTEITFESDQLICGLEPHQHTQDACYVLSCTIPEHNHETAGCKLQCNHTHTLNCYKTSNNRSLIEATPGQTITTNGDGIYTYTTSGWLGNSSTHYYLYLNGEWYCAADWRGNKSDTTEITLSCTHTHTDACYTCAMTEHAHSFPDCYTLTCNKTQHAHTDNCYSKTLNMNSALWTLVKSDTVTVAADGSTVINVYYDRTEFTITFHYNYQSNKYQSTSTVKDKWGADIGQRFLDMNDTAKGNLWSENTNGNSPWTSYLQIMPQNDMDFYCRNTSTNAQPAEYYTQNLDGTYGLEYTVTAYYDRNLTISKEDFYEMEGFSYSHGTDGDGESMTSPGSYGKFKGAKFYYNRNSYILDFNNGEGVVETQIVLYEASLTGYAFVPEAPSFYEPGSVKFAGWYQNPECTGEQYILSEHAMPANNVILYAKWIPVTHMVKFYTDEAVVGTDTTPYKQYDNIPHGSKLQYPYTPPDDPEKGQYIFVGWFYIDALGNEQMWDFENTTVTRDVSIYAKWSSNTLMPYEVRFVYKDGDKEIEIADRISGSALGGNSKTFEAKGNDQLYGDYREGYFPTVQSHTILIDLDDTAKNYYTFYYEKIDAVPYTVYYLDASNNQNLVEPKKVEDNKKAIVTETYVKVPGYLPDTYQQTLIIDADGENKIVFYYSKDEVNGMYVVHYWIENLYGAYTEHSIFEGRGEKGSTVSATIKTIENFTYVKNHTGEKLSGQISTDEVLELHVYYERNSYPYKVQYLELETNAVLQQPKIGNGKWGEIVEENAIPIDNYTLVGDTTQSIQIQKDTENPTVNIITFYYKQSMTSLTISKKGAVDIDKNQTFLFRVQGDGVDLVVTVHGNDSVTVSGLKAGAEYTVTEITDWSWRYEYSRVETGLKSESVINGAKVTLSGTASNNAMTVENTRKKPYWLDGNSYRINRFTGSD